MGGGERERESDREREIDFLLQREYNFSIKYKLGNPNLAMPE